MKVQREKGNMGRDKEGKMCDMQQRSVADHGRCGYAEFVLTGRLPGCCETL